MPDAGGSGSRVLSGYRFEDWELWPARRLLLRQGRPVPLGGRAFDLLWVLLEQPDRLMPKDELLERVWPGLAVEPNNLQVQIWALRRLLGSGSILTVARRGYRFMLRVQPTQAAAPGNGHDPATAQRHGASLGDTWQAWAAPLQTAPVVTLVGAHPHARRHAAEQLAAQRRSSLATALWRIDLLAQGGSRPQRPALPAADDPLWRRLAAAPGQLLLLDCQQAPQSARQLVLTARASAPGLQLLLTADQPLRLSDEVVADVASLGLSGLPDGAVSPAAVPAQRGLRWQVRHGQGSR